jgi:hypothetical protein
MGTIPQGTEIPKGSSQFAKLQDGKNRFRILSEVVVGWEMWQNKKPTRHEGSVCKFKSEDADVNQNGKPNINYFWAVVVWNYVDKLIQTLEITQKTIMNPLYNDLEQNPDWGDLRGYDIEINKKKEGDKVTYSVIGIPPKPVAPEILEAYHKSEIDLTKLFDGKYPIDDGSDNEEDEISEGL